MALSITVNGGGTFSASMEEGPVSFTATLGAVPGPKGDTGATGASGVVAATAPITYNSGTQTVSIDPDPTFNSVTANDITTSTLDLASVFFSDNTTQTTAFVGEARKVYVTARNNSGSTIAAGKVVYLSGATGNKPTIALAQANAEGTSARVIGLTVESIANNADGKVIISGSAENIDTSAFNAGDVVYLSASTAGGMTTTLPTQPYHGVAIGIITRANPSVGSVEVSINNYQELEELSDVLISSATNLDLLSWDTATGTWKNKSFSTLGLLTSATAASTYQTQAGMSAYAPLASPTFTGTVTIPAGASISGYLTTATAASTYAPLASPALTGTPTAPTAASATNTTQIATTAFVQQEVPAASTTTAGKVQLATDAQTTAVSSTTLAVTPSNLAAYGNRTAVGRYANNTWSGATSGTGALTQQANDMKLASAPTSATGYGTIINGWQSANIGTNINSGFDWSKRIDFVCRYNRQLGTTDSNSLFRILVGRSTTSYAAAGDLAARGIGVRCVNGSAMQLHVHNGTTLTNVTSSHTPTTNTTYELRLLSDGAGNVTLYIDGTQVATTASGPSSGTVSGGNGIALEAENIGTVTGTKAQVLIGNYQVTIGA